MACLNECRFFNRALNIDDLSKRPHCKNLKFKRAFQFLQLLLIQRVYGIDVISYPPVRQPSKHSRRHNEQLQQQQNYQVFLGGSCNPTTWRRDQAIPYFQSRSVSFYNPQVSDWSPELVEIEHRAKELAPLLFFVIDYDTRALASIVEVSYLAARGRSIIVVMNPMPDRSQAKFMQQKHSHDEQDDVHDYENACEARRTLRSVLRSLNIPFFDDVRLALECAAFILESTKRTVAHRSAFSEDNDANDSEEDVVAALPRSPGDFEDARTSSVVVIRSLSNKTSYDSPDEFMEQMRQSGMNSTLSPFHRRHSSTPDASTTQFRATAVCTRTQVSCSTTESDDDGYASLSSSNRTLSSSSLSVSSELFEATADQQREDNHLTGSDRAPPGSPMHRLMSTVCSYIPFVSPPRAPESSMTQSLFVLFTLPFRFIKQSLLFPALPASPPPSVLSPAGKPSRPKPPSSLPLPVFPMYDLYIASGTADDCWLETFALPTLQHVNVTHTKRQSSQENDQLDALCDMHARKQSRLLYYLINGRERLADLTTELAFLIGERKHKIIVYMQSTIDDDAEQMLSPCERRDVHRSRKYLEDLTRKENVTLCHSREQSWEHVLAFFSA